jgi:glutamyl-tRNA synthetase
MPSIDAMAKYLGIAMPEINVVDFFKSGYLPETMVNFIALLGWNPGDNREVMRVDELINCFDISNLAKSNSLFDRKKLAAFNTEHIKMTSEEALLGHFKNYLKEIGSVVCSGDDELLKKLIKINEGARTLADIEKKSRFLFVDNSQIEYNEKAVKKVLLKAGALDILAVIRGHLAAMDEFTEDRIEQLLRGMAEEKEVGLGKVAQPLRVAICGDTVSPPIFNSVNMLGKDNTLARIDITLEKFNAN